MTATNLIAHLLCGHNEETLGVGVGVIGDFMARPAWMPLHRLPMYRDCPAMDLVVAEDLYRRLINIPSSPHLAEAGHG